MSEDRDRDWLSDVFRDAAQRASLLPESVRVAILRSGTASTVLGGRRQFEVLRKEDVSGE